MIDTEAGKKAFSFSPDRNFRLIRGQPDEAVPFNFKLFTSEAQRRPKIIKKINLSMNPVQRSSFRDFIAGHRATNDILEHFLPLPGP